MLPLAIAGPCVVVVIQFFMWLRGRSYGQWQGQVVEKTITYSAFVMWTMMILPLLIALEAAVIAGVDHAGTRWMAMLSQPERRAEIYGAKFVLVSGVMTFSCIFFGVVLLATEFFLSIVREDLNLRPFISPGAVITGALQCAEAALTSLQTWVSLQFRGFSIPIATGVLGMIVGFALYTQQQGGYLPWLLPSSVVNSTGSAKGALVLSSGTGLIAAALGCWVLSRRDP